MNFSNFLIVCIFSYILIFSSFSRCIKLSLISNPVPQQNFNIKNNLRSLITQDLSTANDIYNVLTTEICIGNPTQCFKFAYDTGNQYLIIGVVNTKAQFSKLFNTSLSETFKSTFQRHLKAQQILFFLYHIDTVLYKQEKFPIFYNCQIIYKLNICYHL